MDLPATIYSASTWIVPILIAITFHEAAHAYAAWRLGDDTAHRLGRVTFNPLKHVDPFGTILLPALLFLTKAPFLFGWAKPVPVAFGRLGKPRRDMAIVALAGPLANVVLAIMSAALLRTVPLLPEAVVPWLVQTLYQSILLNLILAIFNMLPLPPLDRGRIVASILPGSLARPFAKLERFGFLILVGIVFLLPLLGRQFGTDLNHLSMGCRRSAPMADADLLSRSWGDLVTTPGALAAILAWAKAVWQRSSISAKALSQNRRNSHHNIYWSANYRGSFARHAYG